jgi:hypothetical protein
MVDDPAATDDEAENKKSGSTGDIVQVIADGATILAGPRPAASVPSVGATSGEAVAGAVEASATVADAASAAGDAIDAAGAVADAADVADAAGSVVGSVLGILDGL